MNIRSRLTDRWNRLRQAAQAAQAEAAAARQAPAEPVSAAPADAVVAPPAGVPVATPGIPFPAVPAPSPAGIDADHDPIVPFGDVSALPVEAQHELPAFGLEQLVLRGWAEFFARFRDDEREFELPHYLEAGAAVAQRLGQLGPGVQPDLVTSRQMLENLLRFEENRFRDFTERVDELMTRCQQLRAQLEVSELSKSWQEDELLSCRALVEAELKRRGLDQVAGEHGQPPSIAALLRQLGDVPLPAPAAVAATPVADAAALDIHARDSLEWTKLHSAAFMGRVELVEMLLARGADVNAKARDGATPLHLAAKKDKVAAAKLLFAKGGTINAKDAEGNSPAHLAVDASAIDMVKALTGMGAYLNVRNNSGWTPLHLAANRGKVEMVDLVLQLGADINAKADNGWTPLTVAMTAGHPSVVELLRQRGGR
jgi:hypothetical protein